ncbi:MAG TPA: cyclic nucleotide-binding domain-containing protein, partial [Accumulibacter sp.]|nr:cyclic nucleotide-binding domain-containing protein [Accumulibacter sp.]
MQIHTCLAQKKIVRVYGLTPRYAKQRLPEAITEKPGAAKPSVIDPHLRRQAGNAALPASCNELAPGEYKCEYWPPASGQPFRKPPMHLAQHGLNIEALLAHVPLFNELEKEEIARLARGTREINATRGDILFHKGDTPTGFYLIVYGQVKLAFTSPQGGEKVVDILPQGQTFGEAVMFTDKPFMVY